MSLDKIRSGLDELNIEEDTRWNISSSGKGPLELTHSDGSKLRVVDAIATSTLRLDYEPVQGNSAFRDSPIRDNADNLLEFIEHIAKKHDNEN